MYGFVALVRTKLAKENELEEILQGFSEREMASN